MSGPAHILMIGAGGLGCAVALALADKPIKSRPLKITWADPDRVALSNLHRQVLFTQADLNLEKSVRAAEWLANQNTTICVKPVVRRLESVEEIATLAQGCELIVDGSDNYATRFQANDAAVQLKTPLIHGAVIATQGQLMTILPGQSACLRCLFYESPDLGEASCRSEGVIGPLVGEIGQLMALEVNKIVNCVGKPLTDRLLTVDYSRQRRREISLQKRNDCLGCQSSLSKIKYHGESLERKWEKSTTIS
ncbi:MAG: HesA/MoeB/ThiF family protein [Magnetococcales bacterium]|nr:HesA/MoeB/ThiF family protein [Magnetococcales bacterium]